MEEWDGSRKSYRGWTQYVIVVESFNLSADISTWTSVVQDFGPIKPLIEHALSKVMLVNPSEHPILVTEPTWNTPANRERMAEIMFEEFNVPAFYIANTGVLNA